MIHSANFGKGHGPIVIEGLQCTGDEEGLHRCFHTHSQSCSHYNDAAVRCSGLHSTTCSQMHDVTATLDAFSPPPHF